MSFSQFGEDRIVDELLGSPAPGLIVDVGAGDGMEISNSRLFRERGWATILVEPNPAHLDGLSALRDQSPQVRLIPVAATPDNITDLVPEGTDVLSIDVDGDDIFLLEALERNPKFIIIEHNPTMPRHIDAQPARLGLRVGSSVKALTRIAQAKGYGLAAVTHCNAIFQHGGLSIELPHEPPAYAVATEYFTGRPIVIGEAPWGVDLANPVPSSDVVVR